MVPIDTCFLDITKDHLFSLLKTAGHKFEIYSKISSFKPFITMFLCKYALFFQESLSVMNECAVLIFLKGSA